MIARRAAPRPTLRCWALLLLAALPGCQGRGDGRDEAEGPDLSRLVPVAGVVTLNGKPLAGAVVTFLPAHWASGIGETDAEGRYRLMYSGRPGVPPDDYKVSISLLVSADGETQGIRPRSSVVKPPGMFTAKEFLPPEYADLGRSRLVAGVGKSGGTFDFNVDAPGVVLPSPDAPRAEPEAAAPKPG